MKVFLSVFVSAILFASDITASPLPTRAGQHHDLSATLSGTLRDLQNLGKAKKAVISYGSEAVGEAAAAASSAAVEYGSEVGNAALEYAADTGNAAIQYGSDASNSAYEYSANAGAEALNTVSSAGNAAIEYASSVDPIQVLNEAEASILASKTAQIESVFDTKRQIVRALQAARAEHEANFNAIFNTTVEGVSSAVHNTQAGVVFTKEAALNISNDLTVDNAMNIVQNTFLSTSALLQNTASNMIKALLDAKKQIHESAAEFDSKASVKTTKTNIGASIQAGVVSAETFVDRLGLFKAIDGLVQAMADVPAKLNEAAIQVELNTEADLQTAIANALDAKITALEAEDEAQAFYDEDLEEVLAMEDEEEEEKDAFEDVQPVRSATKDPSVEVEVLVSGDVDMEANELKGNIEEAIQGKITRTNDDTEERPAADKKAVSINIQFDNEPQNDLLRSAVLEQEATPENEAMDEEEKTEAEAKKVEIRVNVMSNVELEETLEQEVVEILKEKIVKDSDDDVLIEVTVSEDLPKEDDSEMVEARTNAKEDKKSAVNLVVLNKEESAQTEE